MASIGELFKFLTTNTFFQTLSKDNDKTDEEIIHSAFDNIEFITNVKNIVDDETVIKNKMKTIIGQNKKQKIKKQQDIETIYENTPTFLYDPINKSNVGYSDNFVFIEKVDFRMRLVTNSFELYY
jgi:hypothetical protein